MSICRNFSYLFVALVLSSTIACEARITGAEGNLQFAYYGAGDNFDFNKPIAVGAKLDLRVYEAVTRHNVTVLDADVEPAGVLEIEEITGNRIVLMGIDDGRTEIRAEAELRDGEVVEDFVSMRSRTATQLRLRHYCNDEARALYLTEQQVWIPFTLHAANDEQLIGYGYRPVDFDPVDSVTLRTDNKDQEQFRIDTGEIAGPVQLTSQIDEAHLEVELVEAASINGLQAVTGADVRVNHTTTIHFQPLVDGERVCQPILDFEVTNLTPDNCEIHTLDSSTESAIFREFGWVGIEGRQAGECTIMAVLEDVNGGAGVSTEASVTINP